MVQEKFNKLDGKEARAALADINAQLAGLVFDPAQAVIMAQPLTFYPGWRLLDCADYSQQPSIRRLALQYQGQAIILDGTIAPLQSLNTGGTLTINKDTVLPYLRFFLRQVRGPRGAFKVIETLDDFTWREEPPPPVRKALQDLIAPLRLVEQQGEEFKVEARLLFGDALFAVDLTVDNHGQVQFRTEDLLREELPVRDDILGQ